ncbi:MAG: response regulator [Peptococcaceae bacterium]|jgi:signal transduction histidine kinase/ActR/RegA family two-component response regulator|nr:response regulator [Peptococcaceae bacterium]
MKSRFVVSLQQRSRLFRFIQAYLFSENLSLDVCIANIASLAGIVFGIGVLALRIVERADIGIILLIFCATAGFIVASYFLHQKQVCASVRIMIMILVSGIIWPLTFFQAGGIHSGFAPVFVLTMALIFLVLQGKKLILALIVYWLIILTLYLGGYYYPHLVTEYSELHILGDTVGAIIIVGSSIGLVDLAQTKIYRQSLDSIEKKNVEVSKIALELEKSRDQLSVFNRQLRVALDEALQASQAKASFLANMSHEMRTPMNAIIGMTTLGLSTGETARKDDALQKIERASAYLLGVINDVLDMSKIESRQHALSSVDFSLADMLKNILEINALNIKNKRLHVHVALDERIPRYLAGDDQHLAQVVTNLLSNAIKFTPEGGRISLDARLIETRAGDGAFGTSTIRMTVRDTGIGVSAEQQENLFTAFQQADSSISRKYGGTGLGLAIAKGIIELMGGNLWMESALGEGAAFTFEITLNNAGPDAPRELAERLATDVLSNAWLGYKILLVDDNEINREIVEALLEDTGVQITPAVNGLEALELFTQAPARYDLILMDMQMPEMDGLEATRRIRTLAVPAAQRIPIVAMTANVFKEDVENCLASGMNGHIGKPIAPDILLQTLHQYLGANNAHTAKAPPPSF